jgi:hypothetical protein
MPAQVVQFAPGPVKNLPPPTDRDYHTILPPAARVTANYNRSFEMKDTPLARPSAYIYGADPQEGWRKNITGNTQDFGTNPTFALGPDSAAGRVLDAAQVIAVQ